ncbi:hypothetical protein BJY00DRAFT_274922 [Aspergillus carlsbadensis]|nr:hypothetical protein BJY00DRAFT_274922 [Aspergillus carlsbadensis]
MRFLYMLASFPSQFLLCNFVVLLTSWRGLEASIPLPVYHGQFFSWFADHLATFDIVFIYFPYSSTHYAVYSFLSGGYHSKTTVNHAACTSKQAQHTPIYPIYAKFQNL